MWSRKCYVAYTVENVYYETEKSKICHQFVAQIVDANVPNIVEIKN